MQSVFSNKDLLGYFLKYLPIQDICKLRLLTKEMPINVTINGNILFTTLLPGLNLLRKEKVSVDTCCRKQGPTEITYSTGTYTKVEGNYVDGKREGTWKFYDRLNRIGMTGSYTNGLKDGPWLLHDQGQTITFSKGEFQKFETFVPKELVTLDEWSIYFKNGKLERKIVYRPDGKIHSISMNNGYGVATSFYRDNLLVKRETVLKNGRLITTSFGQMLFDHSGIILMTNHNNHYRFFNDIGEEIPFPEDFNKRFPPLLPPPYGDEYIDPALLKRKELDLDLDFVETRIDKEMKESKERMIRRWKDGIERMEAKKREYQELSKVLHKVPTIQPSVLKEEGEELILGDLFLEEKEEVDEELILSDEEEEEEDQEEEPTSKTLLEQLLLEEKEEKERIEEAERKSQELILEMISKDTIMENGTSIIENRDTGSLGYPLLFILVILYLLSLF